MMTSATLSWGMSTREPTAATKKGSEAAGGRQGRCSDIKLQQSSRSCASEVIRGAGLGRSGWQGRWRGWCRGSRRRITQTIPGMDVQLSSSLTGADLAGLSGQQVLCQSEQAQALRGGEEAQLLNLRQGEASLLSSAAQGTRSRARPV